ncbi:putative Mutator transposable element [Fagus crenata]
MHYLGGQMKLYKGIDTDILGIADLDKVATNLGYRNVTCYYSKFPGDDFEEVISICSTDGDVMRMVNRMENAGHTVAQIYLEHRMDPLDSSQVDDPLLLLPEPTNDPQAQNDQTDPELTEVAVEMENSDYEEPNDSGSSKNERLIDFEDSDEEGDYIDILKEAKNDKCDSKIMVEKGQSSKQVIQVEWDGECDSDYSGSEELWPPNAGSDDECNTRCLEFNEEIDMKKPINLKVGLTFQSAVVFRKALKEYCIQKGYDYTYLQNEKWRVTAECKEKCGWRIHASLTQMQDAFRIKTFTSEHNCGKHYHNRRVTSSWIASKYWEYIRDDITWTCDALKEAIRRDYNVFVSKHKCYKAKHLAIKMIHGSELEQFKKLWSYCAAIRKWQPGSTIELLTEGHKFLRLYGIVETLKNILPKAEHRFCVRHLYANFNKLYKGQVLKDAMWKAARACTEKEFLEHMKEIQNLEPNAHDWLKRVKAASWSKHAHNPEVNCDMLLNNLAETFNSYILEARDKPIITMLEIIRQKLMKRFHNKRDERQYESNICPRIKAKLEKSKDAARDYIVRIGGVKTFEVDLMYGSRFVVDLGNKSCTCRRWDLSGIPCSHAVACIYMDSKSPEEYVDPIYTKEKFMAAYEILFNPVPSEYDWPATEYDPISPLVVRTKPGRPKKARRKEEGEEMHPYKVTRKGLAVKCGKCYQWGHNARTCKAPENPKRRIYSKKANKRAVDTDAAPTEGKN